MREIFTSSAIMPIIASNNKKPLEEIRIHSCFPEQV